MRNKSGRLEVRVSVRRTLLAPSLLSMTTGLLVGSVDRDRTAHNVRPGLSERYFSQRRYLFFFSL